MVQMLRGIFLACSMIENTVDCKFLSHIINYLIAWLAVYCSLIYYVFRWSQLEQKKNYKTPELIAQQKFI